MSPRLLLSPTPSLSLPIPFSSHYAPQAGAAKRRYATGIGDERRRDPAWSDVSGSGGEESDEGTDEPTHLTHDCRSVLRFLRHAGSLAPLVSLGVPAGRMT